MIDEENSFKWIMVRNGVRTVAIVNIEVVPSESGQNEILEHYAGKGFYSQGYLEEVSAVGYDSWKQAARKGLEYGFSLVPGHWTVHIYKIEGRTHTDTNPATVGYTMLLAFLDKVGVQLSQEQTAAFENYVEESWTKANTGLIPDFFDIINDYKK